MAPYLVHRLRPTRTRAIWRRSDLKGAAMPVFLNTTDADFETRFTALLSMKREDAPEVDDTVAPSSRTCVRAAMRRCWN
jgi:hypothetical protein